METNSTDRPKSTRRWRGARRLVVSLAIFATLIAVFYVEENWRGKRAWEQCKRELEAQGADFNWEALIPPPVPDAQNFFKAPQMAQWLVRVPGGPLTNDLSARLIGPQTGAMSLDASAIKTEEDARKHLAWTEVMVPDLDLIREALRRPYAQIDGDYSQPMSIPQVNFVGMRTVAQVSAQRARCHLKLGAPDQALRELTLIHNFRRILEAAPTGKPMTLVAAMINVAIVGLYTGVIADGLQANAWREPQLIELQRQLAEIQLAPIVTAAFACEQIASTRTLETLSRAELVKLLGWTFHDSNKGDYLMLKYAPQGWIYQNLVAGARFARPVTAAFDLTNQTVLPRYVDESARGIQAAVQRNFPYNFLPALAMPNFIKAIQTTARNQALVNQGQIACALERYRGAHGAYPESLGALTSQFGGQLPRDVVGGQPFHYQRQAEGKFALYSVGWNETDDGGHATQFAGPGADSSKGDWVWQAPVK